LNGARRAIVVREFAEPATTWKGAFLRAAAWSGPHLCAAALVGQLVVSRWRVWLVFGLLLVLIPVLLAVAYRSWRVGVASSAAAAGLIVWVYIALMVVMRTLV
jgi:predicted RND superfamily exporter protein